MDYFSIYLKTMIIKHLMQLIIMVVSQIRFEPIWYLWHDSEVHSTQLPHDKQNVF